MENKNLASGRTTARRVMRWTIGITGGLFLVRLLAPSEPDQGPPGLAPTQPATQQGQASDLPAAVRIVNGQVELTNRGSTTWTNCRLSINEGVVSGGYELTRAAVAPRTSSAIPAREFAKSSGERFDLIALKPNTLSIFCDTPSGRESFLGRFE